MKKAAVSLTALLLVGLVVFGQTRTPKSQGPPGPCPPVSLSAITEWLDGSKHDAKLLNPDSLAARIRRCGISFEPTDESRAEVQKHGNFPKVNEAIEHATKHVEPPKTPPATQPPPPPPPPQGHLTVTCQPPECEVSVAGASVGTIVGGKLSLTREEGPVTVSVSKTDYESDKGPQVAAISEKSPALVEFKFKPSAAALEAAAGRIFQRMVDALGGDAGLKADAFIRGTGTLTCYRDGKPTTWDVTVLLRAPDKARFMIRRTGQTYDVTQTKTGLMWQKPPRGNDGEDLEFPLRLLQQYQISEVVGHLRSANFRLMTERLSPGPGEDTVLHATAGSDRTAVTLDPDFRPKEILLESAGLDTGRKIVYSAYFQKADAYYPKTIQLILPGAGSNGFELKFADVELSPSNVNDADFVPSKSAKPIKQQAKKK